MGSALDCEGGFDAGYEEREELDEFAFSQYGEKMQVDQVWIPD